MGITEIIFLLFGLICLVSAVAIAVSRQLIRAAFWLFAVLLSVGALFAFVGADILTVSQIIVYVGGILILIVYGVMLTNRRAQGGQRSKLTNVVPASLIVLLIGTGLFSLITEFPIPSTADIPSAGFTNVEHIGLETMTRWLVPFEAVSVLLLITLIGAAFIARPDQKNPRGQAGTQE